MPIGGAVKNCEIPATRNPTAISTIFTNSEARCMWRVRFSNALLNSSANSSVILPSQNLLPVQVGPLRSPRQNQLPRRMRALPNNTRKNYNNKATTSDSEPALSRGAGPAPRPPFPEFPNPLSWFLAFRPPGRLRIFFRGGRLHIAPLRRRQPGAYSV